ncbi:MAG: endonuclease/exonuclease/phosphatase [Spiribacter salinus]|uniref:Endonuclease/exonuclease/phosphatase n=1 Tax=Spiribacter salinus TaxID=1335746 RepID=A0A540VQQ0_9GAMM|nr:MAG: endonuclease/exonuclease/phosphatase [Spiribacter salinus]
MRNPPEWRGARGALLAALLLVAAPAVADLRLASWNIRHLGWDNDKDMEAVASVAAGFDLIAIQELMDPAAVELLIGTLAETTGESWRALTSQAFGRSSYREHYTFVWRGSEVELTGRIGGYPDPGDRFAREPFAARFRDRDTGEELLLATVHIVYGDTIRERALEITTLDDYWVWLDDKGGDFPIVLVGDFNLAPDHASWNELDALADPLLTEGATTLSTDVGEYANLYDNLWLEPDEITVTGSGIFQVPRCLGLDHEYVRERLSDHAPVYLTVGSTHVSCPAVETRAADSDCVDINSASAEDLTRIKHIGSSRARAIIQGRPWTDIDDLQAVHGISRERLADIRAEGVACINPP